MFLFIYFSDYHTLYKFTTFKEKSWELNQSLKELKSYKNLIGITINN